MKSLELAKSIINKDVETKTDYSQLKKLCEDYIKAIDLIEKLAKGSAYLVYFDQTSNQKTISQDFMLEIQ